MEKGNRKKNSSFLYVLFAIGFLIGAGILFYPTISDLWNHYRNQQLASDYASAVEEMEPEDYSRTWEEARAYNREHTVNTIVDAFDDADGEYLLSHPYDRMLKTDGSEIMGYLDIPKISVRLPIYHGAGAEALEKGCGHIEGTSLPIGGSGTHAVLSAHRGLPSAKLFSDLDQLEEGDVFLIHVLDEVLAYKVDQVKTVLPTELEEMAIQEDRDLVTLVTCTPYGVNTHRLLVRGTRTEYIPEKQDLDTTVSLRSPLEGSQSRGQTLLVAALVLFIVFILLFNLILGIRDRRKKRKNETTVQDAADSESDGS